MFWKVLLSGLLVLPCTFGALAADGEGAVVSQILRSGADQGAAARAAQAAVKADPSGFMVRAGEVILQTDLLDPAAGSSQRGTASFEASPPRVLALELFPDAYVEVQVTSESRPSPGTITINGRVSGSDLSTFSMTLTPESYLMNLSDPGSPYLYRVVGDTETGVGRVTEYDARKRPPVIHSPPVVPPLD